MEKKMIMKSRIREILEGYTCNYKPCWHHEDIVFRGIDELDFDDLEKELQKYYDNKSPLDYIKPKWGTSDVRRHKEHRKILKELWDEWKKENDETT